MPRIAAPAPVTRRQFIYRTARFGGAAALGVLTGLDLLARDPGTAKGLTLERPIARDRTRKIVVLGAGVAGLSAAYQLGKAGHRVRLLEARTRPGGRCWTVRAGSEDTDIRGEKQLCRFASGQYFNAGPMRIAQHHTSTLAYCREFGIPLVNFTNFNEAAYVYQSGGKPKRLREVTADLRGHTSELLAKVLRRSDLDQPLTAEDREKLIEYLRAEGRLDGSLAYRRNSDTSGSASHMDHVRGYRVSPGAHGGPQDPVPALELEDLIKAGFLRPDLLDHDYHQQPAMLTPSGGMDAIPRAFASRLGEAVRYQAEIREIRRSADGGGVRILYADTKDGGALHEETADFCLCAMPPHLLARIPNDFSAEAQSALAMTQSDAAGKIGLQFRRRFWEEDDGIYGGRSLSNEAISQIYYPSEGYAQPGPAALIGYYHFSDVAAAFSGPHAERERLALEQGARIHPQYREEFDSSFSVEWDRVRYSEMAWALWGSEENFKRGTARLREGDGPFFFAGDWLSNLNGWQAGAFVTAHVAAEKIHTRALQ